jgi:hypothetical protein
MLPFGRNDRLRPQWPKFGSGELKVVVSTALRCAQPAERPSHVAPGFDCAPLRSTFDCDRSASHHGLWAGAIAVLGLYPLGNLVSSSFAPCQLIFRRSVASRKSASVRLAWARFAPPKLACENSTPISLAPVKSAF